MFAPCAHAKLPSLANEQNENVFLPLSIFFLVNIFLVYFTRADLKCRMKNSLNKKNENYLQNICPYPKLREKRTEWSPFVCRECIWIQKDKNIFFSCPFFANKKHTTCLQTKNMRVVNCKHFTKQIRGLCVKY